MRRPIELPTLLVAVCTYAALIWGTTGIWSLQPLLAVLVTGVAVAQFGSLQHEVLHGHPTGIAWLDAALVFPAVNPLIPYLRFKDLHLAHHYDPVLTDPYDDPESNYQDPAVWARMPRWQQRLLRLNNTLLGRMLIGPIWGTWAWLRSDLALWGQKRVRLGWGLHAAGVALVLVWLLTVAEMPLWAYMLAVWLGYALLKIRSYLEHRAHVAARARTVIIEDRSPLSLLFLNNNFHAVHHMHPDVPWYKLPGLYALRREHYLRRNDGYRYASYTQVFAQYFLRAKDPVPHPIYPVDKGSHPEG
jgi:fatty acid desaturase